MIGYHLWQCGGGRYWVRDEERRCVKCGAIVKFVKQPRRRSRVFKTITIDNAIDFGAMSKCKPS